MHQAFQDGLALACHWHHINLFITVTCNPKWPKIQKELLENQDAADQPDLIACVFAMYQRSIIDDIYKKGIFGCAVACIHTIEFQKCGLPHMHLLIILDEEFKITTPDDVDCTVQAYWPDPNTEPELFNVIKSCMVHGPCSTINKELPCMKDGKCSKGYPKPFHPAITMTNEGYPVYKQPDDRRAYEVNKVYLTNQWIVPYSPYLSSKYWCHINVECVVSFVATKYITKYTHKGPD
jgi:hypothetical protein